MRREREREGHGGRGGGERDDGWAYRGTTTADGVPARRAASPADEPPFDLRIGWSTKSGLVLEWQEDRFMASAPSSSVGELVSTDAPLA